jgi:glycine/D-amino acid oxidase-like deaminating enzyme
MVDAACAEIVAGWLTKNGVTLRTGATLTGIEESRGKRKLSFAQGAPIIADVVIMATGIRANLEWLDGADVARSAEPGGGISWTTACIERQDRLCRRRRGARRKSPDRMPGPPSAPEEGTPVWCSST